MIVLAAITEMRLTDWGVLSFLIVQLIAFIRWVISIDSRLKIAENDQKDHAKYIDEIKKDLKSNSENDKAMYNDLKKELKRIEDKSDLNDKDVMRRIDNIAQGLVKAETLLEQINRKL